MPQLYSRLPDFYYEGENVKDMDINSLSLEEVDRIRDSLKQKQLELLSEIRALPPEDLDVISGDDYESMDLRWSETLCTHYIDEGQEVQLITIDPGRFPDVYAHSDLAKVLMSSPAYKQRLEEEHRRFEEEIRGRLPGKDLVFVTDFHGLALYGFEVGREKEPPVATFFIAPHQ